MGSFAKSKRINNKVSEHCKLLIDDFFNYADGRPEQVTCLFVDDIKEPMPPTKEQLQVLFARAKKAWLDYCEFTNMPRESRQLFINKVKMEWHRRVRELQRQKKAQKRKRYRSASN